MKRLKFLFLVALTFIAINLPQLLFSPKTIYAAGKACTAGGNQCVGQTYCADTNAGACPVYDGIGTAPNCTCASLKPNNSSCTIDNMCSSSYCTNSSGGGECSSTGLSAPNCVCANKQTSGRCTTDAQCGNGTYCANKSGGGACAPLGDCTCQKKQPTGACTSDAQCGNGTYCANKAGGGACAPLGDCVCTQKQTSGACTSDTQCANNYFCKLSGSCTMGICTGTCTQKQTSGACTSDTQCANNYYCGASGGGKCIAGIGGQQNCGCVKNGATYNAPPANPPPATPPCIHFTNGVCDTISSDFGPFNTMPGPFITKVFGIILAASGAIAVLLIMRAGYKIMTARGNPEGLQQGREQLIAAIVGLMFLIFSFVLLQVIGADLLKIPGFK